MSERWPGGIVRATPVTPTGPLQSGTAPGMWTLDQANYWIKQGLWPIAGNFLAVEDVFSTYLYTGTGSAQTITNGINLSGQGGMVWIKSRSAATNNFLFDTTRGVNVEINSDTTDANATLANSLTAFNSNGFSISSATGIGVNAATYASWTFREAANFFDVVTYTGNGANRTIAHNLGVAPGCILVKRTDTTADWQVYHRSNANTEYMVLNTTAAKATGTTRWNSTTPTATEFTVGTDTNVNASGGTYVAYLFAHDTSSTGLIQCGSVTATTGQATVTLGWEPQWVLVKQSNTAGQNWIVNDVIRNMSVTSASDLQPSSSNAEQSPGQSIAPTATGFTLNASYFGAGTYIYIAIRRAPMLTPTVGTSVFSPVARTGTGANATVSSGFVTDFVLEGNRTSTTAGTKFGAWDRLRFTNYLISNTTAAEVAGGTTIIQANPWDVMDGYKVGTTSALTNASTNTFINWMFRRAPSFFDQVHFTGTGSPIAIKHNLGVVPELIIVKNLNSTTAWTVYSATLGAGQYLTLNATSGSLATSSAWNNTSPTASDFTVGTAGATNNPGSNITAYLFATCPGVSKVGSYAGNGSSQTINCAFTTGARFVMVKRTNSTGDWYVWDSARGIVAGNDPYLALNTTAAEVTTNDSVDTDNTGFIVNQVAASNINVNGASYIFLAIA